MQIAFGRVRRKTEPTGFGTKTVIFSKIDTYGATVYAHLHDLKGNSIFIEDRTVIDKFVRYLERRDHPGLKVDRRPDDEKEYQNLPSVDAIAGNFAIEHTSIDTLPNQRRNANWFGKVTEGIEEGFAGQLPFCLSITFDYDAVKKNYVDLTLVGKCYLGLLLQSGNAKVCNTSEAF